MSLEVHIPAFRQKQNASNKQHKCEICEKVFKTQQTFKNHFRIVHDNKEEVITCNICTKTFKKQTELNNHIKRVHGGNKNYKCNFCSISFLYQDN